MNPPAGGAAADRSIQSEAGDGDERWRRLYDHVPAGLFELDARGKLTRINPAGLSLLGDTDVAALRDRLTTGRVFRRRRQLIAWFRALARGDTVQGMELALDTVGGGPVYVVAACAPVRDERGLLRGFEGSLTDVTAIKALQREIAQVQKLEVVGQLTGGIAHDFNNLLTIINGNLYLIEQDIGEGHQLADLVAATRHAARQGADLTRSLLAFARRESREPELVDLHDAVLRLRPLLERALGSGIELGIDAGPSPAMVWMDTAGFESALLNLAINARDAMPDGGAITIAVGRRDGGLGQPLYRITVEDTGTGMADDICARVFEPFFTTKPDGSGLGLAMVQRFVKEAHGSISVDSSPGRGTRFHVDLPGDTG